MKKIAAMFNKKIMLWIIIYRAGLIRENEMRWSADYKYRGRSRTATTDLFRWSYAGLSISMQAEDGQVSMRL